VKKLSLLVLLALGVTAGLGCSSSPDKPAAAACSCKTGCSCGHCSGAGAACTCKK
jgi:hypothetical protein